MRLTGLLFLLMPMAALAQPAPKPLPSNQHKPSAHTTPANPKPAPHKPASHKPAAPPKPVRKPAPPAPHPAPAAPTPVQAPPPEPNKGSNTGLPLPRFASLRSDDVNFRSGPGTRYPIEWVYKRRDLPVEIEREFEIWRLIKDPQGNKGWVHQATLTGRRTAVVAGSEHVLRQAANAAAAAVAKLEPGVIIRLRTCDAGSQWCQAQIGDYRGYIKRNEIWGVLPDEVIQ